MDRETEKAPIFRYVGRNYLLFYGPSGRKYRFRKYGQELEVDPRDRDFVRDVPNVREVRPLQPLRAESGQRPANGGVRDRDVDLALE